MNNIKWPKVIIIILNWNQKKMTADCISNLLKNDYPNFQIWVIDNGSEDGSPGFLKKIFGSRIILLQNKKNLGYAEGNNLGIRKAREKADFILIINNDVKVEKKFLTQLIKSAQKYEQAGLLVPKVYYPGKLKIIQSAGGKIVWRSGEARLIGHLKKEAGQYSKLKEIDYAPGVCVLVRKKILNKIGLIPKDYFMYSEDVDWSQRAKKAGYQILYVPKSKIYHYHSKTAGFENPVKTYYYFRNSLIFMKKWSRPSYFWLIFLPFFHFKIGKIMIKYLFQGKKSQIRAIMAAYFGFWHGKKEKSKEFSFESKEPNA